MKIDILGTEYTVEKRAYKDDPMFERHGFSGYCTDIDKLIVIGDMLTFPDWEDEMKETAERLERTITRHEVIHAFLSESGLDSSSMVCPSAWAKNEEMIDWFALQSPKILKVYKALGCLES